MHLNDAESGLLKTWVIKKLEHISDADSDVLADYVLALVKTDESTHVARSACIENLHDFLGDSSKSFVDDLFAAISTKAYDPSQPTPKHRSRSNDYDVQNGNGFASARQQNGSRKRAYHDWDRDDTNGRDAYDSNGSRPLKQPRRGGRGGRNEQRGGQHSTFPTHNISTGFAPSQQHGLPAMPMPLPGMPAFDPSDPMASLMAMQQAMNMFAAAMPEFASQVAAAGGGGGGQRCIEYDTKGFCTSGVTCPHEHGNDRSAFATSDLEYDPAQATLLNIQPTRTGTVETASHERGRGGRRGRARGLPNARGGGRRAEISQQGPMNNRSITTIVVEQIPEEKCDDESIRQFFDQFGGISEITIRKNKRLALVKFVDHDAARAAYDSPKVVFDNRFVKVYWQKPQGVPRNGDGRHQTRPAQQSAQDDELMADTEPAVDPAEFAKRQEEAQRKYEEGKKQREEQQKQKLDLDSKLKAIEAEREKMAAKLAMKKSGGDVSTQSPGQSGENAQTDSLRAQLAKLEAEAKSLGIDPDALPAQDGWSGFPPRGRGRGSFRGRPGRGGYAPTHRGGWAGGAVKRLDNRPKTVAVTFREGVYEDHDEALRQWMLFNSAENATLSKHPTEESVALLAFTERYLAENFMRAARSPEFPLAEQIDLSWHQPEGGLGGHKSMAEPLKPQEAQVAQASTEAPAPHKEVDYDVAADDDLWG